MNNTQEFADSRRRSRHYAVQALYQWQMTQQDLGLIDQQFRDEPGFDRCDLGYFQELLHRVPLFTDLIATHLAPFLHIGMDQLDPVERAIIWIAGYELLHRPELDTPIIVSEAVGLAKRFGADQSYRFVSGVLNEAARKLRPQECAGRV